LPANCGGKQYLESLDKALRIVDLSRIEEIAVSAGFDTYLGDLASLGLIEQDYFDIGKKVALLGKPTFFVLEGGYVGEKIGLGIDRFLRGYEENMI
jgi:acetoin utilization deacetylase AcuC-like enzyme